MSKDKGKGLFFGVVATDGKLTLSNRPALLSLLRFHAGHEVVLEVRRRTSDRTAKQNKYYWGVVVRMLAAETGYTQDEMHDALRYKFLRREAEGFDLSTARSTKSLTTAEFSDYVDTVRDWAAASLGIVIPAPHEVSGEW